MRIFFRPLEHSFSLIESKWSRNASIFLEILEFLSLFNFLDIIWQKQSGAVEAYWARNPEVRGSNPGHAFRMDLQRIDAFRDHLFSIKEKLSSKNAENIVKRQKRQN